MTPQEEDQTGRRTPVLQRFALLFVVLGVLLVYARSLEGTFILDDRVLILSRMNELLDDPLWHRAVEPFWIEQVGPREGAFYRPLVNLSFAIDARLHGLNAAGYHLTNSLLHVTNAVFFYFLLRQRSHVSAVVAILTSLSWSALPRLAEAGAWISGRTDVMAATFVLAALLTHRPTSGRRWVTAGLLLLGMCSKEVAVAGVIAVGALEFEAWRATNAAPKRLLVHFVPPLLATVGYIATRQWILSRMPRQEKPGPTLVDQSLLGLEAIARYTYSLVASWTTDFENLDLDVRHPVWSVAGLLLLLLFAFGTMRYFGRGDAPRRPLAPWALGLVSIGLVLHLLPLPSRVPIADRFLYIPTLALLWGIAPTFDRCVRARSSQVAWAAVVMTLGIRCYQRIGEWNDELAFWLTTYRQSTPTNALPAGELGSYYSRVGLFPEALAIHLATLARVDLDEHEARTLSSNAALEATILGDYARARRLYALLCNDEFPHECLRLARLDLREFRLDEADLRARSLLDAAPVEARALIDDIRRVRAAEADPMLQSPNDEHRAVSWFRLAALAGQRARALELGRMLVGATADEAVQREVVDYIVRFADIRDLQKLTTVWGPRLPEQLRQAAALRWTDAQPAINRWPEAKQAAVMPPPSQWGTAAVLLQ